MDKAELIEEIIELQREADKARRQYELDVWMNLPLTIAQLKSLFFISNQGSTNSGKLAATLRVTPTNITGIIDRLVKQGLVSRTENQQDRRIQFLRTTEIGEELLANLRAKRRGYLTEVLTYMTIDELAILARGIASLVKAAETHEAEVNDERPLPVTK